VFARTQRFDHDVQAGATDPIRSPDLLRDHVRKGLHALGENGPEAIALRPDAELKCECGRCSARAERDQSWRVVHRRRDPLE
jgi:hypothetical protein